MGRSKHHSNSASGNLTGKDGWTLAYASPDHPHAVTSVDTPLLGNQQVDVVFDNATRRGAGRFVARS